METAVYSQEQTRFAYITLYEFYKAVHKKDTISYYLETSLELEIVLQIFIRINSGGTKLSYSDLLLSIATAEWKEKDAREVIHQFVDEINKIGDGFDFNKDLVFKSCLVLADFPDIAFKVDNFNKENMLIIEKNWGKASVAIKAAIDLVSKLGYSKENLVATNTIIPIAYFIQKNDFEDQIMHSGNRDEDRKSIKEWLARVLLKGTFGGQPDSIYPAMRDLINKNLGKFPLQEIIEHYKGSRKSILFSIDDIESILDLQYGKPRTFCALSLLYPGLNNSFKYHQDHIHPQSFFNKRKLKSIGVADESIDSYLSVSNSLSNLQLLQATENIEKKAKPFADWLNSNYPEKIQQESYLMQHHINCDQLLDLNNFLNFIENRRANLKTKFLPILSSSIVDHLKE